jgi:hypothetical protein
VVDIVRRGNRETVKRTLLGRYVFLYILRSGTKLLWLDLLVSQRNPARIVFYNRHRLSFVLQVQIR